MDDTQMATIKEFLTQRMVKVGIGTVKDLCDRAGVETPSYYRSISDPDRETPTITQEKFADELQFSSWKDLVGAWRADDVRRGLLTHPPRRERLRISGTESNVDASTAVAVYQIPEFDLSVAAGPWVEVPEIAEVYDGRQIDHGRFRIRIRGDSMMPKYQDGSWVEFRCLRTGRDVMDTGGAYYVQRSDGTATFKIVERLDDDQIVLRALNRSKYPEPMPVPRQDVVRMARAEWILSRA